MKNLIVMFGGPSVEHDVSVITAVQLMKHVNPEKYQIIPIYWTKEGHFVLLSLKNGRIEPGVSPFSPEVIKKSPKIFLGHHFLHVEKKGLFLPGLNSIEASMVLPIFHGGGGEDGSVQGLLEVLDVPYSGCGVTASAVGMDKVLFKAVMQQHKIKVLDFLALEKTNLSQLKEIPIPYPVIVKPVHLGSSIGVKKAESLAEVKAALEVIFELDDQAMIEPFLSNMMEINCSVLGSTDDARASVCEQPVSQDEILSFADKYLRAGKGKKGMKSGMASLDRRIPAPIDKNQEDYIRKTAVDIFQAVGCSGVARIDFMIDKGSKEIYVTEINTIPGSMSFYLWEASGISYTELLDKLVEIAEFEHQKKKSLIRTYDSSILEKINLL